MASAKTACPSPGPPVRFFTTAGRRMENQGTLLPVLKLAAMPAGSGAGE